MQFYQIGLADLISHQYQKKLICRTVSGILTALGNATICQVMLNRDPALPNFKCE